MSGYSRPNRFAGGKPNNRKKYMEVGSRMEWKPKPKVTTDGSLDDVSCVQKDNSSLPGKCTSEQMPSGNHKPDTDISLQQEDRLPVVEGVASGMENLKLMSDLSQRADSDSVLLGSVSASCYEVKDSLPFASQSELNRTHPNTEKQKGERSVMAVETQRGSASPSGFKLKDSPLTPLSEPIYKYPSAAKSQTGRSSDMIDETCNGCSSHLNMYSTPTKSPVDADNGMGDRISEMGSQLGQISQGKAGSSSRSDDSDRVSSKCLYDICPKQPDSLVKLKAPLLVKNREKRNEMKRSVEGQNISVLRPGMVLMKRYISIDNQIRIVKACRDHGIGDGGFYKPGYRDGATLHLKMMCLGKNWDPESGNYGDTRPVDNAKPPRIPHEFNDLVKRAIQDSHAHIQKKSAIADPGKIVPSMSPNICIVNFYTKGGKLGLHQDKDESAESLKKGLPVVSFSIGDSAEFLYGDVGDIDKADKVILESGDVLIFGGKSRRIFHGVASILPGTAPTSLLEATNLLPGRLNLTFREY